MKNKKNRSNAQKPKDKNKKSTCPGCKLAIKNGRLDRHHCVKQGRVLLGENNSLQLAAQ